MMTSFLFPIKIMSLSPLVKTITIPALSIMQSRLNAVVIWSHMLGGVQWRNYTLWRNKTNGTNSAPV